VRLGVYSDLAYRSDGLVISTDQAFVRFVAGLPPLVDEVVLFGRLNPEPGRGPYVLPSSAVRFVPLPHYRSVWDVGNVLRAARESTRIVARELNSVDAFWAFGPHPLALLFARLARRRGVPLLLGVRQHYPEYVAARVPGRAWRWTVAVAHLLDLAWRRLARGAPTVAIGEPLAARYGGGAPVLAAAFPLVTRADLIPLERALARLWDGGELRLISVGRLDPEKNPHLLLEAVAALRRADPRWRLTVVGDGPLRAELEAGGPTGVDFRGYVPSGDELWKAYDESVAFVHVSLTEGLPQVLAEAQAAGLPIVATDVGGVRAALDGGDAALLVPPRDADAIVRSLRRLADDAELREDLIRRSVALATRATMEREQERIVAFARDALRLDQSATSRSRSK
jgi:glycosyltransferase involved in cell wall biosynthesis